MLNQQSNIVLFSLFFFPTLKMLFLYPPSILGCIIRGSSLLCVVALWQRLFFSSNIREEHSGDNVSGRSASELGGDCEDICIITKYLYFKILFIKLKNHTLWYIVNLVLSVRFKDINVLCRLLVYIFIFSQEKYFDDVL